MISPIVVEKGQAAGKERQMSIQTHRKSTGS